MAEVRIELMTQTEFIKRRALVEERLFRGLPRGAKLVIHEVYCNEVLTSHEVSDATEAVRLVERSGCNFLADCELSGGALFAVAFVVRPRYQNIHPAALFSASVWIRDCISHEWPDLSTFRVSTAEEIFIVGVSPTLSAMSRDGAAVVQARLTRTAQEVLEHSGLDPLQFWIAPNPAYPLPKLNGQERHTHAA